MAGHSGHYATAAVVLVSRRHRCHCRIDVTTPRSRRQPSAANRAASSDGARTGAASAIAVVATRRALRVFRRDVAGDRVDRPRISLRGEGKAGPAPGVEQHHGPETARSAIAVDHAVPRRRQVERSAGANAEPPRSSSAEVGRDPRQIAAVEDCHPRGPEALEHPPQPRRDPSADVVVGDDERSVADPGRAHRLGERGAGGERVAPRLGPVSASSRSTKIAPGRCPASYFSAPARAATSTQRTSTDPRSGSVRRARQDPQTRSGPCRSA